MLAAEPDEAGFSIFKREDVDRAAGADAAHSDARLFLGAVLGPLGSPFIPPIGGRRRRYLRGERRR